MSAVILGLNNIQYIKKPVNPTLTDKPTISNALWLNTTTGELFAYNGDYNGKSYWIGQNGTEVYPLFDIFNDNSSVLLYRFENSLKDTGGTYHIQLHGTLIFTEGRLGSSAFLFDGHTYLDTTYTPNSIITISFWLKQGTIDTTANHCILHISQDDSNSLSFWQWDGTNKMALVVNDTEKFALPTSSVYEDNLWHHYVITSTGLVYVDGNLAVTVSSVDTTLINRTVLIGADRDPDAINDFIQANTSIDQFRIFNRELTSTEVLALYNESI